MPVEIKISAMVNPVGLLRCRGGFSNVSFHFELSVELVGSEIVDRDGHALEAVSDIDHFDSRGEIDVVTHSVVCDSQVVSFGIVGQRIVAAAPGEFEFAFGQICRHEVTLSLSGCPRRRRIEPYQHNNRSEK